jgi:hypothetical protein
MDFTNFTAMIMPIVLLACLCVGYVLKQWPKIDNRIIPTVMLILGAALGCVANKDITLLSIVAGGFSGLASTGLYEAFAQWIKSGKLHASDDADNDESRSDIELKSTEVTEEDEKKAEADNE